MTTENTATETVTESTVAAVEIVPVEERAELHYRYPGQSNPQPVFVWLDCERARMGASSSGEIGGAVPFRVWYGHEQRFQIPALRATAANSLLAELAPVAARIVEGYSSEWNGHNHVARFTEEAREAIEEARNLCERTEDSDDKVSVWDAGDYYASLGSNAVREALGITGRTTDEELDAIEAREIETAEEADVIEGLSQFLRALRDEESDKIHEPEDADQADDADEESDEADEAAAP